MEVVDKLKESTALHWDSELVELADIEGCGGTHTSAAGDTPGLDGLHLRPSRFLLTFLSFTYNVFTRVFLSLTSNRRLRYSYRA